MTARPHVVVVGAGIIGRTVAWRLAQADATVTIVDPDPRRSAAQVAAGMLAPVTEARASEQQLLALTLAAAAQWPAFAAELAASADRDVGYAACGTLVVARDRADVAVLDDLADQLRSLDVAVERLTSRQLRGRDPGLAPAVRGGLAVPGDHQVDPRRCLGALAVAAGRAGVREVRDGAAAVDARGVDLLAGGRVPADHVVVCAGWASGALIDLPVRPVKGQILRVRATPRAVLPSHVVRGLDVYVVPRPDGEIVIGATTEEVGAETDVTAGGVRRLLDEAWRIAPGLDETVAIEAAAGLRPGTPDGAPLLGTTPAGIHVATGHHRHGVLLAPLTAAAVTAAVCGAGWPAPVEPFGPDRFGRGRQEIA